MRTEPKKFYHLYNRGNNKQTIFFNRGNYLHFLRKIRKYVRPHVQILSYCLMPNHFHFLIFSNNNFSSEKFSEDIRIMLSSYTQGINNQENRSGSLFRQNTKAKNILGSRSYRPVLRCFYYIHQNPVKANLVSNLEDWEFSSFPDYAGFRNGTLCNKKLAIKLLDLPDQEEKFYAASYRSIDPWQIRKFYM